MLKILFFRLLFTLYTRVRKKNDVLTHQTASNLLLLWYYLAVGHKRFVNYQTKN